MKYGLIDSQIHSFKTGGKKLRTIKYSKFNFFVFVRIEHGLRFDPSYELTTDNCSVLKQYYVTKRLFLRNVSLNPKDSMWKFCNNHFLRYLSHRFYRTSEQFKALRIEADIQCVSVMNGFKILLWKNSNEIVLNQHRFCSELFFKNPMAHRCFQTENNNTNTHDPSTPLTASALGRFFF